MQQITPTKLKGVLKHQTSEDTHYSKIRSTVSVHSLQQLQRHLQQHQACRASTLTLAPSKSCNIPQRQCNQPSFDVLIEIRQACLGHNVVPSISGARPSGRRQRVRSVAEQVESLKCNRHGLLCSCQQQSLHSVGGHYNVRLCKLSRPKRRRNFHEFSTPPSACAGQSNHQLQLLLWLLGLCIPMRSRSAQNCAGTRALV